MKINVNDSEKINAELVKVQANARVRTISVTGIEFVCDLLEKRLGKLMPRKYFSGVRYYYDAADASYYRGYRGTPESTAVMLERGARNWFVVGIARGPIGRCKAHFTEAQKTAMVAFVEENLI